MFISISSIIIKPFDRSYSGTICDNHLMIKSMAMTQEPIDRRYRFHIFLAYFSGLFFREYPHKIWPTIWY